MDKPLFAAVVQATMAVVTSVIAWLTYRQSIQIRELATIATQLSEQTKELAKHTGELQTQSKIFQKSLEIEKQLTLLKRRPFLVFEMLDWHPEKRIYSWHVRNIGADMFSISFESLIHQNLKISSSTRSCKNGEAMLIEVNLIEVEVNDIARKPTADFLITSFDFNQTPTTQHAVLVLDRNYCYIQPPNDND